MGVNCSLVTLVRVNWLMGKSQSTYALEQERGIFHDIGYSVPRIHSYFWCINVNSCFACFSRTSLEKFVSVSAEVFSWQFTTWAVQQGAPGRGIYRCPSTNQALLCSSWIGGKLVSHTCSAIEGLVSKLAPRSHHSRVKTSVNLSDWASTHLYPVLYYLLLVRLNSPPTSTSFCTILRS